MSRKKITKTLRTLSHNKSKSSPVVKGILTGTALIISGYGIANAVKAVKASADAEKKKRKIADVIILGRPESGTNPHSEECHRCTCHGVPVDKVVIGTPATGQSPDIGEAIRKQKMIEANTVAMNSLDSNDRAFMKSLIDFLRETELVDELDESVTTASLIGYMKENGIFDEIHHICNKKDIACDETMKVKENIEVLEVLENIEQLHHMEQIRNDESEKEPMYMDDFGH